MKLNLWYILAGVLVVAAIISYNLDGREHLTDPKKKPAAAPPPGSATGNIHKLANKLLGFLEGAPTPQVAMKKLSVSQSKSPIKPRAGSRPASKSNTRSRSKSPPTCKPRHPPGANLTLPGPNTGCTKCCGKNCGAKHLAPAPFVKKSSIVPCTCTKFSMSCGRHAGGRSASRVPGYMGNGDGSELRDVPGFLNSFDAFSH
jgi:hypothetical protein